ncbi:MAG TPA: tetratricopeptide repeat protein [Verrucomicrobiae bacterium]|nr:tetratricopeptide repeat protein [Verrucomicrobiae bacterium]
MKAELNSLDEHRQVRLICIALALGTLFLYCPVLGHDFITFDDWAYVLANPHVRDGLSLSGISWAFAGGSYSGNWHPLTWISHMVDCQLYGLDHPGGHHFTNVLFHIANTLLLFVLLKRMTGALWRSAAVAALFAWHPVHVESVAWIAERKDVLSAFFWLLTMLAYVRYAAESQAKGRRTKTYYTMALIGFALGLMSKPMVVTLPFVLLLMDYWPLKRGMDPQTPGDLQWAQWKPLVREKLPFIALSFISCVVTFISQKEGGAVSTLAQVPFWIRLFNTQISYVLYLGKIIWPTKLAILYPLEPLPGWMWIASCAVLLIISSLALIMMRRCPWLFTGWFWFLGTLVPVIGLVQVGRQLIADRYTYLPAVGIFIAVVWGCGEFLARVPRLRPMAIVAGAMGLCICMGITENQLGYWKDSVTLFTHALAVARPNTTALNCLALGLERQHKMEEAMAKYKIALQIEPQSFATFHLMGLNLASRGNYQDAVECYNHALSFKDDPTIRYNLGNALAAQGKYAEAEAQYTQAIRADPDSADLHNNLGAMLARRGLLDEAMRHFQAALRLQPNYPEAQDQLAALFQKQGRLDLARIHYAEAIRLKPDFAHAQLKLGYVMAQQGDIEAAIPHFQKAITLESTNADAYFDLGAAYAALENWRPAVDAFSNAAQLKPGSAEFKGRLAEARAKASGAKK